MALAANALVALMYAALGFFGSMADTSRTEANMALAAGASLTFASLLIAGGIAWAWSRPVRHWWAWVLTMLVAMGIVIGLSLWMARSGYTSYVEVVVMGSVAVIGAGCAVWCVFSPPDARPATLCTNCNYDLAGLPTASPCPECGTNSAASH